MTQRKPASPKTVPMLTYANAASFVKSWGPIIMIALILLEQFGIISGSSRAAIETVVTPMMRAVGLASPRVESATTPPPTPTLIPVAKISTDIQKVLDGFDVRIGRIEAAVEKLTPPDPTPTDPTLWNGSLIAGDVVEVSVVGIADGKANIRVTANNGPRPPPEPVEPVDPVVPVTSFRVIFVKESGSTLTPQQTAIPQAKAVREYLFAKTTRENEVTGWREYDPHVNVEWEQPGLKALWENVKPKLTTIPCIVIEVNSKAEILPYPANAAEALALLKKYGG